MSNSTTAPTTANLMANRLKQRFGISQIEQPTVPSQTTTPLVAQSSTKKIPVSKIPTFNRSKSLTAGNDAAKTTTQKISLPVMMGYKFDNSLADEISKEVAQENEKRQAEMLANVKINQEQSQQREEGINEILSKIDQKLNSAKQKFNSALGNQKVKQPQEFQIQLEVVPEKTPSTAARTQRSATTDKSPSMKNNDFAATPAQFSAKTDENGNRMSILPGESRPVPQLKSQLDILKSEVEVSKPGKFVERKNFVKMNMLKNYQPRMRGAAFTNKLMAKKSNSLKFKARIHTKMKLEQMKNRDQVNAYGGLGKVGLDYEHGEAAGPSTSEYQIPAFSPALQHLNPLPKPEENLFEDEDEMLVADFDEIDDELRKIDSTIIDPDEKVKEEDEDDAAAYKIPTADEGFLKILKERFGHDSFKEGQLEAIKIILNEKCNALVVLATGGGKSLIYQYTSLFMPGLVLIVTPLIALMTDQLNKLPDFLPGASINSQQNHQLKQNVVQAVIKKHIKILFITPERLFMEDLAKFGRKISMVCVDEIHCASEWSHNFRPTYLMLHEMVKEKLGDQTRVLGLTATATRSTQRQICQIFDIKYPEHLVTQPNLSRLNLQLSITRDAEKTKALMTLLKSESYKPIQSILLFATQRRTTEQVASYLCAQGITSAAYHAGKSDEQRAFTQKQFCQNKIRVLCCTIAFSMGIDKSDIQSVIHYDLPRSIENYVQEIGRAGRDGTLARCHMFLNNDDFYQLRRITLSDLLDSQSCFRLTSKVISQSKRELLRLLKPDFVVKKSKKRKSNEDGDEDLEYENVVDVFEHEDQLKSYYNQEGRIRLDEIPELQGQPFYIAIDTKELMNTLDLKKEIVMTMLNQLEKVKDSFFKVDSILPASIGIRFHKKQLDELAQENKVFKAMQSLAPKSHMGVYRVQTIKLALAMGCKPYNIPRYLYQIQMQGESGISYETDHESFILKVYNVPSSSFSMPLSESMHYETRKIENALVSKLNCMYFVARKVSVPSIEALHKREKTESAQIYIDFSAQLNDLINKYFRTENEETMEVEIAGSVDERNTLMPLLYIDSHREKAELEAQIKQILRDFHHGTQSSQWLDPANRMKPLDVVKVLMGIQSSRESVKRFGADSTLWAKRQEYDYDDILKVATQTVQQFYLEMLPQQLKKQLH